MINSNLVGAITGLSIGLLIFVGLLIIAYLVLIIIANWKIFEKNGEEGWKAIIPFYNTYIFTKIAGLNWWYVLILIFGNSLSYSGNSNSTQFLGRIIGIAVYFLIFYNLAKKAKKDPIEFGILGALFSPIMKIIIGFSNKYQFDNSVNLNPNGIFGENIQQQNNEPDKYCLGCGQKLKTNSKFCDNCGKPVE